jgi:hypothetical protein
LPGKEAAMSHSAADCAAFQNHQRSRGIPRWVLLGALILPLAYLPSLSTRFDFIDDGNLVYPMTDTSWSRQAQQIWRNVVDNYEFLGPFRPVLWVQWHVTAQLTQGSDVGWRATRLAWCAVATFMLLWLLAELGIPAWPALAVAALSMWSPYRNEFWLSLTLSEGIAMPYALFALICARRAPLSRRAWAWDVVGVIAVLMALGCKNTFAAVVPAQCWLRIAPDELTWREGLRRHGRRAALLSLTLLAFFAHYVYFKLNWRPGQYTVGPSWEQARRVLSGLGGAMSITFMGTGLLLAGITVARSRRIVVGAPNDVSRRVEYPAAYAARLAALGAGALLLVGGAVLYLPMGGMSGRYTVPAAWGLDLFIAVLLTALAALPRSAWTSLSWGTLAIGLGAVLVANVGKQQKFAVRARLLWETLEWVERTAPPGARVAWLSGDSRRGDLNVEEGIHFQWHLSRRRPDVLIGLFEASGAPLPRRELPPLTGTPDFAIWGVTEPGEDVWQPQQHLVASYWGGLRTFECRIGERTVATSQYVPTD